LVERKWRRDVITDTILAIAVPADVVAFTLPGRRESARALLIRLGRGIGKRAATVKTKEARPMAGRQAGGIDDAAGGTPVFLDQRIRQLSVHESHGQRKSLAIGEGLAPAGAAATAVGSDNLNEFSHRSFSFRFSG
jgi:hypothetical protein